MNAPSLFEAVVIVFGTYRVLRLVGWDDFPPVLRVRQWIIGEEWVAQPVDGLELGLPGKQPTSEVGAVRPGYRRPLLAHLIHCPYCVGFHLSLAVYTGWLLSDRWTVYALAPFALSGVIGLIARNWDP